MPVKGDELGEIWLSVVRAYRVGSKERHVHCLEKPVIDAVSCLYIMVSYCYGVVSYIFSHPCIDVLGCRVNIIVIVGGIVPLETVPGINDYYIFSSVRSSHAVHVP